MRLAAATAWVCVQPFYFFNVEPRDPIPSPIIDTLVGGLTHPVPDQPDYPLEILDSRTITHYLSRLGVKALVTALNSPDLDAAMCHVAAREMLDRVFQRIDTSAHRQFETSTYWSRGHYQDPRNQPDRMYRFAQSARRYNPQRPLSDLQKLALQTIINNDLFWQLPTNLFSFFYGLPDAREALAKLTADGSD